MLNLDAKEFKCAWRPGKDAEYGMMKFLHGAGTPWSFRVRVAMLKELIARGNEPFYCRDLFSNWPGSIGSLMSQLHLYGLIEETGEVSYSPIQVHNYSTNEDETIQVKVKQWYVVDPAGIAIALKNYREAIKI